MGSRIDGARNRGKQAQEHTRSKNSGGGLGKFNFGEYQDVKWLAKLEPGIKVEVDIIPFVVTSDMHPDIIQLRKDWEGTDEILDHYVLYYQHRNLGPDEKTSVICPSTWGHPCPICEAREALIKAGKDWKDEDVRSLKKVARTLMNVVSSDDPKTILLFDYSYAWFYENVEKKLRRIEDDSEQFWLGDISAMGRTLRCYPEPSSFSKQMAGEFKDIEFIAKKNVFDESIIDKAYKLDTMLKEYTYDEVETIFNGDPFASSTDDTEVTVESTIETTTEEPSKESTQGIVLTPAERRAKAKAAREAKLAPAEVALPVCPYGHKFGEDNFSKPECDDCALADTCEKRYEKIFEDDDIPF